MTSKLPLILNIETSTKNCSVALFSGSNLISEKSLFSEKYSHSETLTLFVEDVIKKSNYALVDLDAISISKGPGSYTGLRIGVSTAKGLSYSLNRPLISVSTLQSMAFYMSKKTSNYDLYCPMIDARRMEVFSSFYDKDNNQVREVMADIIDKNSYNKETRETFAWVFDQILKLLHPFMPFITEELWQNLSKNRDEMLIVSEWPKLSANVKVNSSISDVAWLQTLVTNLRSVRADMNIPPSKMAPLLVLSDELDQRFNIFSEQLKPLARVSSISLSSVVPSSALQTVVEGVTYAVPLEGLLDKKIINETLPGLLQGLSGLLRPPSERGC